MIADQLSDAGQDPSSQIWLTIGHEVVGYGPGGEVLYEESHDGLDIVGIGVAMAYVENTDGDIEARNVVTGKIDRAYGPEDTGQLTVPISIAATGTGILEADDAYYLVPAVSGPDQ